MLLVGHPPFIYPPSKLVLPLNNYSKFLHQINFYPSRFTPLNFTISCSINQQENKTTGVPTDTRAMPAGELISPPSTMTQPPPLRYQYFFSSLSFPSLSSMSSMSIPSSFRAISSTSNFKILPNPNLFLTPSPFLKPLISLFPHSFTSFKSISFQKLPTKPQSISSSFSSLQPIEELPPKLQEIIKLFQSADNPRAKYQQLMFYATKLPPLDEKHKTKENKVEGCVSQVWVRAFLDENGKDKVYYEADSDSIMTKGLAALLVLGLSGQPITEIVKVTPDFVTLLGLQQNLTPSRNNGFLNMLRLMQRKALFLGLEAEKQGIPQLGSVVSSPEGKIGGVNGLNEEDLSPDTENEFSPEIGSVNGEENPSLDVGRSEIGGRGERIREVLERELKPVKLEIEDVSYQHAGLAGVKGSDGETHFNLKIVSNEFQGKSLVKRHRIVYGLLQDELQSGLHALSIVAKTPAEVEEGS